MTDTGDSNSSRPIDNQICLLEKDKDFQKSLSDGDRAFKKLKVVVLVCFFFMVVEVAGGLLSGSLAILTDAAHMLSDVAGFGISMFSIWVSRKKPSQKSSFGYHRAEVLGALGSVAIIWLMVIWLIYEATDRILYRLDDEIDAFIMLITSFVSLGCNLFSLSILGHMPCGGGGNFMDGVQSIYKPHGGHDCGHDHGHGHGHGHGHSHGHSHDHHDHKH